MAAPGSRVRVLGEWGGGGGGDKMGGKMNILDEKLYFVHSNNFKLSREIKGNTVDECDYVPKRSGADTMGTHQHTTL